MKSFAKYTTPTGVALALWLAVACAHAQTTLRPEVQKPLAAAQEALKNNQLEQALRLTKEAADVPSLTAVEQQFVWRLQAMAALRGQQWTLAIDRLEALLALADLPAADRLLLQEMQVNATLNGKDFARTAQVARQYLQAGGANLSVRTALLQSQGQLGEHQRLVQDMDSFLKQDQAQNRKTPESELRLLGAAMLKLKDAEGYFSVLKRLVEFYPSKPYWADAIVRLSNLPSFNNRYELDAYRLLVETDNLEEADEHMEMASLALKAGLPAEAQRVLEAGHRKGILGQGSDVSAHTRLLSEARKKAQEDDALLSQLEQGAKDGNAWLAVAEAYASKQSWAAAVVAYDKALRTGGLRRETEAGLHRGIALFKSGEKAAALAQWNALKDDITAVQLASLWALLVR